MLFMLKDNRLKDSPALEVRTLLLGRLELSVKGEGGYPPRQPR